MIFDQVISVIFDQVISVIFDQVISVSRHCLPLKGADTVGERVSPGNISAFGRSGVISDEETKVLLTLQS